MRWVLVFLVLLASCVYVLTNNQKRLIREGDLLFAMGKPLMAISMYERALLNYVPFSPYNEKAVEKIKKTCQALTEKEHKLFCQETLRSALYQLRGFYVPYSETITKTEKDMLITKLELYIQHNNPPPEEYQQIFKELKAITDYDPYPSVFWSFLVVFSLAGWIGSAVFLTLKANKKAFLSFLVFLFLWLLGLYLA
jgi:hypothetical protein